MRDYYQILEVEPSASFETIRKAYRRLALLHHPDKNDGSQYSARIFAEIIEAYKVLSNPYERKRYHQKLFTTGYDISNVVNTPEQALEELVKLKEVINRSDPFRLFKEAVLIDLNAIVQKPVIDKIAEKTTADFKRKFIITYLDCIQVLDLSDFENKLKAIANITDEVSAIEIAKAVTLKKKTHWWEKYQTLVAFTIAVLICLLIYFMK